MTRRTTKGTTKRNKQTASPPLQQQNWFYNKNYKDFLFGFILSDKKVLLELYNALNGTCYTDVEGLKITTLKDVIYMGYKNDLSFLIGNTLNLYEHQSIINPNMPLRGLLYIAALFDGFVSLIKGDLYGTKLIRLPFPQYIVFYNGKKRLGEQQELRLSDAYLPVESEAEWKSGKAGETGKVKRIVPPKSCLDFTATVLNINHGHNTELLSRCRMLEEYAIFVAKVRRYLKEGMTAKEALELAIDDCIEEEILRDILLKNRAEVTKMLLTEFNATQYIANRYAEGREEGKEEEREEGIRIFIEDNQEEGVPNERIQEKLRKRYHLELSEALSYLEQYSQIK